MKRVLRLLPLLCLLAVPAQAAQDPEAFAKALFPPVPTKFTTPGAATKTFTSYDDSKAWLDAYTKVKGVTIRSLQKTPTGKDIWAVHFAAPKGSLRMMIVARVHGNEPAASEGALQFIHELAKGELKDARKSVEVLVIPFANPDGALNGKRQTSEGGDINRDYITRRLPETQTIIKSLASFNPHVLIDAHEYTVWGRLGNRTAPYDLLIAAPNEPNMPTDFIKYTNTVYYEAIVKALAAKNIRGGLYELLGTDKESGKLEVAESATTFVSAKNFLGMTPRISFLFEGRGIGIGNQHMERRTMAEYTSMKAVLETTVKMSKATKVAIAKAEKDILSATQWELGRKPVKQEREYPMADADTNSIVNVPAVFINRTGGTPGKTVEIPWGYVLPASQSAVAERLQQMNITVTRLKKDVVIDVEPRMLETVAIDGDVYKGVPKYKMTVKAMPAEKRTMKKGDYLIQTKQNGRLYLQMLEAESPSSFGCMGFWGDKPAELPVYRIAEKYAKVFK